MLKFEAMSLEMKGFLEMHNCKNTGNTCAGDTESKDVLKDNIACACTVILENLFIVGFGLGRNKEIFEWNLNKFEMLFEWIIDNSNYICLNWHGLICTFHHIALVCKQYCANKHWIDLRYLNIMISYLANNMIDKLKNKIDLDKNDTLAVTCGCVYPHIFQMALKCRNTSDDFYHVRVKNLKDLKECIVDESHDMHNYGIIFKDLMKNIHLFCQNIEKMASKHCDCNYIRFLKSDEWINQLIETDAATALLIKDIVHTCVF